MKHYFQKAGKTNGVLTCATSTGYIVTAIFPPNCTIALLIATFLALILILLWLPALALIYLLSAPRSFRYSMESQLKDVVNTGKLTILNMDRDQVYGTSTLHSNLTF
jgi:hypothetical protein